MIIKADSFAHYGTISHLIGKWDFVVSTGVSFFNATNPTAMRAILATSAASLLRWEIPAGKEFQLHFYLSARGSDGGSGTTVTPAVEWRNSSGGLLADLRLNRGTGGLSFTRNGTTIASGGQVASGGVMSLVEIRLKLDDTSSGFLEVRINGVQVMHFEGQTSPTSADAGRLELAGGGGNNDRYFGRVVLMDWSGTRLNDFMGPLAPVKIPLIADATVQMAPDSGTDNFDRVNEDIADADTSYVESDEIDKFDDYEAKEEGFSPSLDVLFLQQSTIQRNADAGVTEFLHRITPDSGGSGTVYKSELYSLVEETYRSADTIWAENPDTEEPWTAAQMIAGLLSGQEHSEEAV